MRSTQRKVNNSDKCGRILTCFVLCGIFCAIMETVLLFCRFLKVFQLDQNRFLMQYCQFDACKIINSMETRLPQCIWTLRIGLPVGLYRQIYRYYRKTRVALIMLLYKISVNNSITRTGRNWFYLELCDNAGSQSIELS